MRKKLLQSFSFGNIALLLVVLVAPFIFADSAKAAGLQQSWVRPDRLIASTATTGLICAKTAVIDVTEANVVVTFPTGFTLGLAATFTTTTTNLPSGATAWAGIGTATNVTGQVVTFPSTDLTADILYCFNWSSSTAVTNSTAGNDKMGTIASGGNSSSYSLSIVSNDQITVNATVLATFSFSLPTNSITFLSNLTTTPVLTGTSVATISTNAASGWVAWVKSANAALNSASTGATITSPGSATDNATTDVSATNGYFLDVAFTDSATGTGTVTQAANYGQEYDGNATNGGTLSTTFQPVAASSGTTDGDTLTFTALAKISAVQAAAADYTDTLTVVAAGRF